MKKDLIYY